MVAESQKTSDSFLEYFKKSRLLKIGLAFNLIYFVGAIFGLIYFFFEGTVLETVYTVDFRVFYEAGQVFISSPSEIYSVNPNGLPFRYFPSFAAYMAIFTGIPLLTLYLINITLMMICNLGIVYFVYQVSQQKGVSTSTKNFERTLLFVFIAPQHIVNIMFGQITQLAILLALIVLFLLQSSNHDSLGWFFVTGILIGLAATLKPFFLVFIPFMVPITAMDRVRFSVAFRQLVGVALGFMLVMLPNIVYFFTYPSALDGFIRVNLFEDLTGQHSTSITKLVIAFVPFSDTNLLQIIIILILGGFLFFRSYVRFVKTPPNQKDYLRHFVEMTFLILLVYPDSWFLFLAIWYAFLAPSMLHLYNSDSVSEMNLRKLDYLWSGANNLLAFFSIGIILHYLILGFDPIIPIWLTILFILYDRISQLDTISTTS
ncbi:MAG: hypothetical protein OEV85_01965 [Candidatus Thorarchaeota archaeon]|nr:hypothetical protein [Candidatus Thorarchaeota archaeon]